MSTERVKGVVTFTCDGCGDVEEDEDERGFHDCWSMLRDRGWRAMKVGTDWVHTCPDCKGADLT